MTDENTEFEPDAPITLADYVRQHQRLSLAESLDLLIKISHVVADRHDRGEVFGIIPPLAVVINSDRSVRVEPDAGTRSLNQGLRAPELAQDNNPSSCSDVYCLGLLFRLMITGHLEGSTGRMPPELQAFYSAATNPRPEERFQTASQLARRARAMQEIAGKLDERWARMNVPVQERVGQKIRAFAGRQWAALCLAMVLAVVFGALGWREWQKRRENAFQERTIDEAREKADKAYDQAHLRDAAFHYEHYLRLVHKPPLRAKALARLIECYRRLKDPQRELAVLLRYLAEFPSGGRARKFNTRAVSLSMEAINRYGGVININIDRVMVVDGKPDDWHGIKPLLLDPPRDNVSRRPAGDIVAFYCVATAKTLFVRFDTRGPPADSNMAFCLGIDDAPRTFSDSSADWDYEVGFNMRIPAWLWDLRGDKTYKNSKSTRLHGARFAAGTVVEASFPLAAINTPRIFSLRAKTYSMRRRRDDDEMPRKVIVGINASSRSGLK